MPKISVYLDDAHVELLNVLKTDGVQPSKLMQEAVERAVEKYGYEFIPARIIKRSDRAIENINDNSMYREVG